MKMKEKEVGHIHGSYGIHPYVLLNYQGTLDHVFTLAHEMGHALHSYYSDSNQSYINAGYKIFVAEVASTCNESLLIHYLLKNTDDKAEKAYLINHFLEQFKGTLYRQTMFAEFEKITHKMVEEGETLTSDILCKVYYDLNKAIFWRKYGIRRRNCFGMGKNSTFLQSILCIPVCNRNFCCNSII